MSRRDWGIVVRAFLTLLVGVGAMFWAMGFVIARACAMLGVGGGGW